MPSAARRELVYEDGEFVGGANVWHFRVSDTGVRLSVYGPRWGLDGDEHGTFTVLEWEGWLIDGRTPTEDEEAEYYDALADEVRALLREWGP